VLAAVTPRDGLAVAFTAVPVVRKYSSTGALEFEVRLDGEWVEELVDVSMKGREAWGEYVGFNLTTDGVNAFTVVTGLAVDGETGRIYCLVGGKEIHVLAPNGAVLAVLAPASDSVSFNSLSFVDGVAYLTDMRLPLHGEVARGAGRALSSSDPGACSGASDEVGAAYVGGSAGGTGISSPLKRTNQ